MNAPDLRSAAVQKLPDAELAQGIANGKGGMPSFQGSLNAGQIQEIVAYVRTLAAKTSFGPLSRGVSEVKK
jgi:mono/diheme cytochrome c family protein